LSSEGKRKELIAHKPSRGDGANRFSGFVDPKKVTQGIMERTNRDLFHNKGPTGESEMPMDDEKFGVWGNSHYGGFRPPPFVPETQIGKSVNKRTEPMDPDGAGGFMSARAERAEVTFKQKMMNKINMNPRRERPVAVDVEVVDVYPITLPSKGSRGDREEYYLTSASAQTGTSSSLVKTCNFAPSHSSDDGNWNNQGETLETTRETREQMTATRPRRIGMGHVNVPNAYRPVVTPTQNAFTIW
jgi:hypothetical protein